MQLNSVVVALVTALLVVAAGTGGALAATSSPPAQQSPTGTTDAGTDTSDAGADTSGASGTSEPGITFDDQNTSGTSVFVESATLPQEGFVVIYDSTRSGNETNQIIGASYPLSAGTSDNIRIQLNEPVNGSKSLTAVVHTDSNGNDQFDFVASNGQQDPPLTQNDRRIVDIAQVTTETAGENAGEATDAAPTESGSGATDAGGATEASGDGQTATAASANAGGENGSGGGDSGSSGPGFGLAVAVVALLAVALLATRRN
jgi:PGF-CTERM protein